MRNVAAAFLLVLTLPGAAQAQDTEFTNPCSLKPITDFDFWAGDWVAFDYDTGVVQGIDRISQSAKNHMPLPKRRVA